MKPGRRWVAYPEPRQPARAQRGLVRQFSPGTWAILGRITPFQCRDLAVGDRGTNGPTLAASRRRRSRSALAPARPRSGRPLAHALKDRVRAATRRSLGPDFEDDAGAALDFGRDRPRRRRRTQRKASR